MRQLIVEAILKEFRQHGPRNQEHILQDALKHIVSDLSLISYAQSLGIDTDAILQPASKPWLKAVQS